VSVLPIVVRWVARSSSPFSLSSSPPPSLQPPSCWNGVTFSSISRAEKRILHLCTFPYTLYPLKSIAIRNTRNFRALPGLRVRDMEEANNQRRRCSQ